MIVKKIQVADFTPGTISAAMQKLPVNEIACTNWPEEFPSKPLACFRIAHDGKNIFLHYFVEEDEVRASVDEDAGKVSADSCVEFFVSFDNAHYYNIEFSCIGKALVAYRTGRFDAERADMCLLSEIKRFPSLGKEKFDNRMGYSKWDLLLIIPAHLFWKSGINDLSGIKATANFYKCGDKLSVPHYLSWNPIKTLIPDFHRPEFFAHIEFES